MRELHVTQRVILAMFAVRTELSPKEAARMLDKPLPNIAYHFGRLAELEKIELVRIEPVRGSYQHYYRLREEGSEERND